MKEKLKKRNKITSNILGKIGILSYNVLLLFFRGERDEKEKNI